MQKVISYLKDVLGILVFFLGLAVSVIELVLSLAVSLARWFRFSLHLEAARLLRMDGRRQSILRALKSGAHV